MTRFFIHSVASALVSAYLIIGGVYTFQCRDSGSVTQIGFIHAASAQELRGGGRGRGSGGTVEGTAGTAGSGAGGATASSGAGAGGTGDSTGPGSVNQTRFGGDVSPAPPPIPTDPTQDISASVMRLLNDPKQDQQRRLPDRCANHRGGKLSAHERVSGANLERLNAAQIYLAPNYTSLKLKSGTYLLANYQEELEKAKPDATVAGSYLGLVATKPVTKDIVAVVNAILCVTSSVRNMNQIQSSAEEQRGVR